ncbi:MAG: hypothetical protein LBB55_01025, partial [Zoogloeaceae bacterium]|nr:hypothetical protein [Zoogloeaceae bacterium]
MNTDKKPAQPSPNPGIPSRIRRIYDKLYSEHAPFWWVQTGGTKYLFDVKSGLLWDGEPGEESRSLSDARQTLAGRPPFCEQAWRLPSLDEIRSFAKRAGNPLRQSENHWFLGN